MLAAADTTCPSFSSPRQSFSAHIRASTHRVPPRQPHFGRRRRISGVNCAGGGERPGIANTPNWDNRLNAGNRANIDNRVNIGNRAYVTNRPINGNNINHSNNFAGQTQSNWNGANFNGGNWYHGNWNGNWNSGWNSYQPLGWWAGGYWAAPLFRRFPGPGDIIHTTTPTTADRTSPAAPLITRSRSWWPRARAPAGAPGGPTAEQQATPLFDAARTAFMQGDYKTALAQVDQAIRKCPTTPCFTSSAAWPLRTGALQGSGCHRLCRAVRRSRLGLDDAECPLSERGCLHGATPCLGAVRKIASGLIGREIPAGRKLSDLRVHRCCGRTVQGSRTTGSQGPIVCPTTQEHFCIGSCPAGSIEPTGGACEAGRCVELRGQLDRDACDSATIKLALAGDGKFTWALDQKGKPQQFSGTYTVADNLLVLKQGDNPMMVGQVASLARDRFNFKLAGDNPSDPGLTFVREFLPRPACSVAPRETRSK